MLLLSLDRTDPTKVRQLVVPSEAPHKSVSDLAKAVRPLRSGVARRRNRTFIQPLPMLREVSTKCPGCKKALNLKNNASINVADFSYIVTCSRCLRSITIRNMISERQKSLLRSS